MPAAPRSKTSGGQALVEFALASTVFLLLVMALFDLGRAIYTYNGVSEAAREIARTTSVHPRTGLSTSLGNSTDTAETIAVQRKLVPGMAATPTFQCVNGSGTAYPSGYECKSQQDYVKVTVAAPWSPITPFLMFFGTFTFTASSTIRLA